MQMSCTDLQASHRLAKSYPPCKQQPHWHSPKESEITPTGDSSPCLYATSLSTSPLLNSSPICLLLLKLRCSIFVQFLSTSPLTCNSLLKISLPLDRSLQRNPQPDSKCKTNYVTLQIKTFLGF